MTAGSISRNFNPALHRLAVATALATFCLLGAGGLVTSHEAGMAVPDWPNTYGYNPFLFPVSKWIGNIFYEHTHRLIASVVGLLTAVLALNLYGRSARPFMRWTGIVLAVAGVAVLATSPTHKPDGLMCGATGIVLWGAAFVWPRAEASATWLRRLGLAAFLVVVTQGVLGGLRVVLLKAQIGIVHAMLAQAFFALICGIAVFTGRRWQQSAGDRGNRGVPSVSFAFWVATATALIFAQLAVGATMRHQHAGLAIPDFPLAYGRAWPATDASSVARYNEQRVEIVGENPITAFQIELQMIHRLAAVAIMAAVGWCVWLARASKKQGTGPLMGTLGALTWTWLGLILLQAGLGVFTVLTNKAADVATAHVLVGALSLATGVILCIFAFRNPAAARENSAISTAPKRANISNSPCANGAATQFS